MSDTIKLYRAEMESERNKAEDAYFAVRPQLTRTGKDEALFRAGFERAFRLLWNERCDRITNISPKQ